MTATKKSVKTAKPKVAKDKKEAAEPKKPASRYFFAIGRRKTAVAKVKMWSEGTGEITVNERAFAHYFPTETLRKIAAGPLEALGVAKTVNVAAIVSGGGVPAQARAVALGLARVLVLRDAATKTVLKKQGMMTRDSRKKERKKPGLKRARRAPQWQKR